MDIVDRDLEKAERASSPNRFPPRSSNEIQRTATVSSSTSSGSSGSSASAAARADVGMTRASTQGDYIERNVTALSRIHTQRSQHSGTVGRSLKSRESRKPLPEFGGGKPYPPGLPAREEYVVEFDGEHDPTHAMNWSIKKK